jgi:hypothetical protein
VNLPKTFSPVDEASAAGVKNASFHRLGDGPWEGTITIEVHGVRRDYVVDELPTSWRISSGSSTTGRSATGTSLTKLISAAISSSSSSSARTAR